MTPCPLQGTSLQYESRKLWASVGRVPGVRSDRQLELERWKSLEG